MNLARLTVALILVLGSPTFAGSLSVETKKVSVNGRAFSARVARAPLAGYRVKIGLAKGRVGHTESLGAIAQRFGARSAIGVTSDRTLLLVTCSCKAQQLAGVMNALGAKDAVNLDGGASCGLYANGKTIVSPGRLISNAVAVVKR